MIRTCFQIDEQVTMSTYIFYFLKVKQPARICWYRIAYTIKHGFQKNAFQFRSNLVRIHYPNNKKMNECYSQAKFCEKINKLEYAKFARKLKTSINAAKRLIIINPKFN